MYPKDSPYKVLSRDSFFSDEWDPKMHGRDFDFDRGFFEQFDELCRDVPQLALFHQRDNENCEYANLISDNKNCYLIFAASQNEECYYSNYIHNCFQVADSFFIFRSELCYHCIDCYDCYGVTHSQQVENCRDSSYLYDCKGCVDCFACVSLVNQKFHFFNRALSETDYRKAVEKISSQWSQQQIEEKLEQLKASIPKKYYAGLNNSEITGDHLANCKNTYDSYDCTELEDCSYCTWLHNSVNCQDCYAWGSTGELGFENHLCGNGFYRLLFCESCANGNNDLLYCRSCNNGNSHLFGCVGMQRSKYCILNKQYSKDEYEKLVPKIVHHMRSRSEWGEFFPPQISPFPYNKTTAYEYFPISEAQARERNWKWEENDCIPRGKETLSRSEYPKIVTPEIATEVLCCKSCERNYRIASAEAQLLAKMSLPIPENCFHCRYEQRRKARNPRSLRSANCDSCKLELQTSFTQTCEQKLLCEECWNEFRYTA
jgi:hypothetical protein